MQQSVANTLYKHPISQAVEILEKINIAKNTSRVKNITNDQAFIIVPGQAKFPNNCYSQM